MKKTGINPGMMTTGWYNTAIGIDALRQPVTGNNNTAIGFQDIPSPGYRRRRRPFKSIFRQAVDPLKNTDPNRLEEFEEVKKVDEVVRTFE